MTDLVAEGALAIFKAWSRERDPDYARKRFERLKPAVRQQFEEEFKAAHRVSEAFLTGGFSA